MKAIHLATYGILAQTSLALMRSYEEANIISPSRSIVVKARRVNHD
jgi:hypothetical protein